MKKYILAAMGMLPIILSAQSPTLEKIWSTDSVLKVPESVLADAANQILYVSNIDGQPAEKDGKGSIGKIGLDGKIIQTEWVKGLNAPKGMGMFKGKLYVADLTEVVVIDIKKGTILEKITVPDAVFLNDISIDKKGVIYVSDSRTYKVHKIENGNVFLLIDKLQGPNGLLVTKDGLLILDKGRLLKMRTDGQLAKLADGMDPSTDGIEMVRENEYVVSCWSGIVYYIHSNGYKTTLIDSRNEKINSADIGYDEKRKIIYVPTFYGNTVSAYRLKQ
ncbi:SMP-30/gluconolactonase/LRE family protein [Sediminibacterium goheungense]|uniref:Sugar lactone lactonase YvrE n=1 Tax=Sediminibacterium goheungense TaxID=1086393 RepID=A0A4R6J1N8_9BACT|nr:ATP/GTP-binding protein [Sediminibacterium goheungense]TDO28075.1 sugar lactone lactonase YvrE [Sediminibacterium goheungense]